MNKLYYRYNWTMVHVPWHLRNIQPTLIYCWPASLTLDQYCCNIRLMSRVNMHNWFVIFSHCNRFSKFPLMSLFSVHRESMWHPCRTVSSFLYNRWWPESHLCLRLVLHTEQWNHLPQKWYNIIMSKLYLFHLFLASCYHG